jgi:hypothetical protein
MAVAVAIHHAADATHSDLANLVTRVILPLATLA